MRASRSLSTRMAALGGALALAASGLVGAVGLVATASPAGATTTQLGTSNCVLSVAGKPTPTPITPSVTAIIAPSPVSAGGTFALSTLNLTSTLDPAANPALVAVAGNTLAITFNGTLSATGASPSSQAVTFAGQVTLPKPFDHATNVVLQGTTGSFTAAADGSTTAAVLLSGSGSLVASVVGTALSFNGPCTGGAPTQIASVKVVPPAASVSDVIPNAGPIAGGTTVKLVGQNLGGATSVMFGNVAATSFQVVSPTVITAVAPAITTDGNTALTAVDVKVTTTAGPPTLTSRDVFTYTDTNLAAIVSGVQPTAGPAAGGTPVTITGAGFSGAFTDIMFGSVHQPTYTIVNDNVITTTAPPGSGVVNVVVFGGDGSTPSVLSPRDRYNYSPGYMLGANDGGIFSFGQSAGHANFFGSAGNIHLNKPIVGMAMTPDGGGYWLVAADGGVFAYGDAYFYGSTGGVTLNKPVVAIATTPDGAGYWLVAADGGVFGYGDALFHGSTGAITLAAPVVGIAPTRSGNGYLLAASDGGVFAFGDAAFEGSAGGLPLAAPVTGITTSGAGNGYLLVGADGGVFAYGGATYHGSLAGLSLAAPASAIAATADGSGYWIATQSGGVFNEGSAGFYGDVAGLALNGPIVAFAVAQAQLIIV